MGRRVAIMLITSREAVTCICSNHKLVVNLADKHFTLVTAIEATDNRLTGLEGMFDSLNDTLAARFDLVSAKLEDVGLHARWTVSRPNSSRLRL